MSVQFVMVNAWLLYDSQLIRVPRAIGSGSFFFLLLSWDYLEKVYISQ
jgi:hypothetical protein